MFLIAVFAYASSYSQNSIVENKIKPAFKNYFGNPSPFIFLHLNKSVFVQGEHLWFKGYVYDPLQGSPYDKKLNLYVGVYDSEGNQVKKELFLSENGSSQGQLMINSTFTEGLYYIKGATSFGQKLKEQYSFIQEFKVINKVETVIESGEAANLNFSTEGGQLINGVPTTVGVKVLNRLGNGIEKFKGYLVESKGDTLASFETNEFGLDMFNFLPRKEESYSSIFIDSEGNKRQFFLPEIQERGIGLNVKRLSENKIQITLGTNRLTRDEIGAKTFSLLFHRDGFIKHIDVTFPKDENFVSYIIDAREFHPNINIITLLDNTGTPIAERLLFNSVSLKKHDLEIKAESKKFDSIQLTLFNKDSFKNLRFLSASILPMGTQGYQHKESILSSLLLKPYVRENIEHPSYYFTEISKEKENDLDLMLLSQGGSRYDWNNIFNYQLNNEYDFKTGVDLIGKLNFELGRNENLLLYIGDTPDPKMIQLKDGTNEFILRDYYFESGDELHFTTINSKGQISRPNLFVRLDNGLITDKIFISNKDDFNIIPSDIGERYNLDEFIRPPETIVLDEAMVVEQKKKDNYLISPIVNENRISWVTEQVRKMYPRVIDIIRSNGYRVVIDWTQPYNRVSIFNLRNGTPPALYVNDIYQADFNNLEWFLTDEIGAYFIDTSGNSESGAGGGIIRLYRRVWSDEDNAEVDNESSFFRHTVKKGFTPVKDFYIPNYGDLTGDTFANFGTIHWEPNIILDENGNGNFTFDSKGWTEFELFIEGMASDGTLFSTTKTIRVGSSQ